MKKEWKSSHGAISVFLSIVLVPCIAFTTLFVDLSRVRLARDLTESAGDLALNSLLTNYDFDLNDFYGMVTSCQNIDEFYEGSAEYLVRLLKSQGLSEDEAVNLIIRGTELIDNSEYSDLLQMEVQTETDAMISAVDEANLGNATIVKDQITNFMKYRAPINLATGFLAELGASGEELEAQEQDENLIRGKQKFFTEENEMLQKAFDIYDGLRTYQTLGATETKMNRILDSANSYRDIYRKIHTAIAKDLYNTGNLVPIMKEDYTVGSSFASASYDDENLASATNLKGHAKKLANYIAELQEAKQLLVSTFPAYSTDMYPIQFWAQNQNVIKPLVDNINDLGKKICIEYAELSAASAHLDPDDSDELDESPTTLTDNDFRAYPQRNSNLVYTTHVANILTLAESVSDNFIKLTPSASSSDDCLKKIAIIQNISTNANNLKAIKSDTHMIDGKSVDQHIIDIHSQIEQDLDDLDDYRDMLRKANSGLNTLKTELSQARGAYVEWSGIANGMNTTMAILEKAGPEDLHSPIGDDPDNPETIEEIGDLTKAWEGDERAGLIGLEEVTEGAINDLKARLDNMEALFTDIIDGLKAMKYGSMTLRNIDRFMEAKNASGVTSQNIPVMKTDLDRYVITTFSFVPAAEPSIDVTIDDSNNPNLDHEPRPELWRWMCEKFGATTPRDMEEQQERYDAYAEDGDGKSALGEDDEEDPDDIEDNPMTEWGESFALTDVVASLAGFALQLGRNPEDALVGLRDSWFATEYVTGMFSYYTYESEKKYKAAIAAEKDRQEEDKARTFQGNKIDKDLLDGDITEIYGQLFEESRDWDEVEISEAINHSLTSKPINATNNWGYRAEWEYVLYGKDSSHANVKQAMLQMYAVRFILNTPSAYMLFWNQGNNKTSAAISSVSTAISGATSGIIPEPLIRGILILVVVALETANDLLMLKSGFPVRFLKVGSKDPSEIEWTVCIESLTDIDEDTLDDWLANGINLPIISDTYKSFHVSYSEYLYLFLFLGFRERNQQSEDMYVRVSNLIEHNLNYIIKDGQGDVLDKWQKSKAITYFDIETTIRVKPLMLDLPIASEYGNNPKDNPGWATFTYKTSRGY